MSHRLDRWLTRLWLGLAGGALLMATLCLGALVGRQGWPEAHASVPGTVHRAWRPIPGRTACDTVPGGSPDAGRRPPLGDAPGP